MTFSIVARSGDGESWGVAVASKFLAVGSAVTAAEAGAGAVATQAWANVAYKREALALLRGGATAIEIPLDDDRGTELQRFARVQGAESWDAWVGKENVEMRVGESWIDRALLQCIRETGTATPRSTREKETST